MKKFLFIIAFLAGSLTASAQYYNPYYGQGSNPGLDRSITAQPRTPSKKKKEEKVDIVEMTVERLSKKLNLDGFQKAAVKVIYNENKDEIMGLADEDIPYEAKKEKGRELTEKIDAKIMALLNDDQKKIYQEMIDDRKY